MPSTIQVPSRSRSTILLLCTLIQLLCASARLHDRRALQAAHHRTQLSAEATTAHKIGAKLQAQATQGRSEAIANE